MPTQTESVTPEFQVGILGHEASELRTAALNCLASGAAADAETLFRAAATKRPWDPDARYDLASAQLAQAKLDEAMLTLAEARDQIARMIIQENAPQALAAWIETQPLMNIADVFYANNEMTAATYLYQRLVDSRPALANLRLRLGLSLQHQGRIDEAIAAFESLVRVEPTPQHHSFLHYALAFRREQPDTLYREGRRWAQMHADPLRKYPARPLSGREGKLRIGYFSPLFHRHQLTKFFQPALDHYDRERFTVVCYSGAPPTDDTSRSIQANADIWRDVGRMDDDAFARQVAADEIDIFVDLWGHTAGNRLTVFARKPAPIQVSWINYVETTGLEEFDYVLHADDHDLPGAQALYSETIMPIGPVVAPFRPDHEAPPAGDTPMLAKGAFTLGCFGHPGKLTLAVIETWSKIIQALPDCTLVLRSAYFKDIALQRAIRAQFAAFGVSGERIVFPPFESGDAFLRAYHQVDLILDPFPYQGMTTGLDALSAGVPVLTLEGAWMHDRMTAGALRACGLPELITTNRRDYVRTAIDLARDPESLNALRAQVRPGFEASPYRQEAAFMGRLEAAYEAMARTYQASQAIRAAG